MKTFNSFSELDKYLDWFETLGEKEKQDEITKTDQEDLEYAKKSKEKK